MTKNTIVSLIKEVNSQVKNRTISDMLVTKANEYHATGVSESEVLSAVLNDVRGLNRTLKLTALNETIDKYSKFEKAPEVTLEKLNREAGLSKSLTAIKSSAIYSDPVIRTSVDRLTEAVRRTPEFRLLPNFIEILKPFTYDERIKTAVTEATEYMQRNGSKLLVLNAIHEMKAVPSDMYKHIVSVLEQALIDGIVSAEDLAMQLRTSIQVPIVRTLLNNITAYEAKQTKVFTLGLGNSTALVESVITPSARRGDTLLTVLNGNLVVITKEEVRFMNESENTEDLRDFYRFCQSFVQLGFKSSRDGIRASNLRNIEFEMKNEGKDLNVYLNSKQIKPGEPIDYSGVFLLENTATRNFLSTVFENVETYINSLDFIKRIVSEGKSCHIVNLGEKYFVIESGKTPTITGMTGTQLHSHLLKEYKYDTRNIFESELTELEKEISHIDDLRKELTENIEKLEKTLPTLQESLGKDLEESESEQVRDLIYVIEKQINGMKDKFIALGQQRSKLFETETFSDNKRYNMHDRVRLKAGGTGKINGVDTHAGRYMVECEDGKIRPMKASELE